MNQIQVFTERIIRFLIYLLVILYSFLHESPSILLSFAIVASISLVFKVRKSLPILLMFLFFITYVINLIPLFFYDYYIFAYPPSNYFYQTLQIHTSFLFVVDVFLLPIKERFYIGDKIPKLENQKSFIFISVFFVFFLVFAVQGDTILDTGGYGQQGNKTSLGGFGEYFLILIPLLYIFGGNNQLSKKITVVLLVAMSVKLLLYGGRIGVLMIGLLSFILYYDTSRQKIHLTKLMFFSLPILYIFVLLGSIRGDVYSALQSSFTELLLKPFKADFWTTYVEFFGNQNDIFYSSTILNQAVLSGDIDFTSRLEMLFYNILSLFVPYSVLPEKANIIPYIQKNIAKTGGGALISSYSYFLFSYLGIILSGIFVAYVVNTLQRTKNILFILYMLIVLSTYPRWFGYNMIGLFKISFYIIPVYLVTRILFQKTKNYEIKSFNR